MPITTYVCSAAPRQIFENLDFTTLRIQGAAARVALPAIATVKAAV
jgi:hypothetical protein